MCVAAVSVEWVNANRYSTVQKTLLKDNQVFTFEDGSDNQQMFGLVTNDLTQIRPNYEAMVKGGTLRITDEGYAQGKPYNRRSALFRVFATNIHETVYTFGVFDDLAKPQILWDQQTDTHSTHT